MVHFLSMSISLYSNHSTHVCCRTKHLQHITKHAHTRLHTLWGYIQSTRFTCYILHFCDVDYVARLCVRVALCVAWSVHLLVRIWLINRKNHSYTFISASILQDYTSDICTTSVCACHWKVGNSSTKSPTCLLKTSFIQVHACKRTNWHITTALNKEVVP